MAVSLRHPRASNRTSPSTDSSMTTIRSTMVMWPSCISCRARCGRPASPNSLASSNVGTQNTFSVTAGESKAFRSRYTFGS